MGKGYNNFMSKKPFHPASKDNIKRVWMAEQRTIDAKKKEDDMRAQYEKEQDLYNNRVMVAGSDSKDKLSLNFMYEAPAGLRKDTKETDEAEPEYKFEWQRNAPRESFAKNNMDIRDQPFGIQVRNVRCLKCHKWGHVNTDRECPLFNAGSLVKGSDPEHRSGEQVETTGSSKEQKPPPTKAEQAELIKVMKEEQGLSLKRNLYGRYGAKRKDGDESNQEMLAVKDPEMAFLDSLSAKEKKKLLKKLQKITNAQRGIKDDDGKVSKKKKKSKKHKKSSKKKSSKKRKRDESDSDESDSDSSPEESEEDKKVNRSNGNRKRESNGSFIDNHNGDPSLRKPIHRGRSPSPQRYQRKPRSRSPSSRSPPPGRRPFNPKAGASQRIVPILRPMSPSERAQFVRENGFGRFGRRSPSRSRSRSPVYNRRSRSPINRLSRSPVNRRSRSPIGRISRSPLNRRSRSPSPSRRIPANGWRGQSSLTRSRASPPRRGRRSPSNSPPRTRRPRSPSPLNRRHLSRSSSPAVAPPLGSRSNSRSYSPSPPRRIPHGGRGPFADRYGLKAPPRILTRSPSPKRNAYRGRPSPPSRRFSPHRGPARPAIHPNSSINRRNRSRSRSGDRY